jgi:hypothetical protein
MDLLGMFANQAAVALDLLLHARRIDALVSNAGDDLVAVAALASALERLEGPRREAALRMLGALTDLLGPDAAP